MTKAPKLDPKQRVFPPNEFAKEGVNYLKWRQEMQPYAVQTGIESLDELLLPLLPPEMMLVQAVSSHGKTQFLNFLARTRAQFLQKKMAENDKLRKRVVVMVSWEQTIEEMFAFNLAAATGIPINKMARGALLPKQWSQVNKFAVAQMDIPLWMIGPSMQRKDVFIEDLTIDELIEALDAICNWNEAEEYELDLLVGDYLHVIPISAELARQGKDGKQIGTGDNAKRWKNLGFRFKCPTVLGAQSKQEIEKRKDNRTPQVDDIEWSNVPRQVCEKMLGLEWPIKSIPEGTEYKGIKITPEDYIIAVLKQKLEQSNVERWHKFFPAKNLFAGAVVEHIDLSNPF